MPAPCTFKTPIDCSSRSRIKCRQFRIIIYAPRLNEVFARRKRTGFWGDRRLLSLLYKCAIWSMGDFTWLGGFAFWSFHLPLGRVVSDNFTLLKLPVLHFFAFDIQFKVWWRNNLYVVLTNKELNRALYCLVFKWWEIYPSVAEKFCFEIGKIFQSTWGWPHPAPTKVKG